MMFSKCCLGEDPAKDGYDTLFRFSFFVSPHGDCHSFRFPIRLIELDLPFPYLDS
jgi:phosphatidylserine decarboxylase